MRWRLSCWPARPASVAKLMSPTVTGAAGTLALTVTNVSLASIPPCSLRLNDPFPATVSR